MTTPRFTGTSPRSNIEAALHAVREELVLQRGLMDRLRRRRVSLISVQCDTSEVDTLIDECRGSINLLMEAESAALVRLSQRRASGGPRRSTGDDIDRFINDLE